MKELKLIGVPEHFNLPWHMAIEEGAFESRGMRVTWQDIPEGTGRMCQMLEDGEADLAIVLTEGITKKIVEGLPARIVQQFVGTPLQWGIHVHATASYRKLSDLKGKKAAISRYGSGSHLMSFVLAEREGWDPNSLDFELVHTLEGAVEALEKGAADFFLWEHFTTKPLVDSGVFRRLGDCPTPWPCFVIAARQELCEQQGSLIRHLLEVINTYTVEFRHIPSIDRTLANRYGQEIGAIREWLEITQWSQDQISVKDIDNVQDKLIDLKLISKKRPAHEICHSHH